MTAQNPLWNLQLLEEAHQHQWILSTSQISALLNITSKTALNNESLDRHGFQIRREGRCGDEVGWSVTKATAQTKKPRRQKTNEV